MGLKVSYPIMERGNTVPYPPLHDEIRRNYGFVDLREQPNLVKAIPEAAESSALCAVLTDIARPSGSIMTLGCDLGEHTESECPLHRREIAGGYLQVCILPLGPTEKERLLTLAQGTADQIASDVGSHCWEVQFALCRTDFTFAERVKSHSIWIWLFAGSSTRERARLSREKLIQSLGVGLLSVSCS